MPIATALAVLGIVERLLANLRKLLHPVDIGGGGLVVPAGENGCGGQRKRQRNNRRVRASESAQSSTVGPGWLMTVLLRRPPLQIRGRRHADHVEAGVDEMHFAGDAT